MEESMECLGGLTKEIRQQPCSIKYRESLAKIKQDPELYGRLNEYRKRVLEIQTAHKTLREEAELEREFRGLLMKESVKEFLYWERETTGMLRKIHEAIDKSLDLDVSFF